MPPDEAMRLVGELALQPHPEGGFYAQTFRSDVEVMAPWAPRKAITSIHFLLPAGDFSSFHRLRSDEIWHHYCGAPVAIDVIEADGRHEQIVIGDGRRWQVAVRHGAWFAAHVPETGSYALCGCDVGPGFEFADFEIAGRNVLAKAFPQHHALIERWTRE